MKRGRRGTLKSFASREFFFVLYGTIDNLCDANVCKVCELLRSREHNFIIVSTAIVFRLFVVSVVIINRQKHKQTHPPSKYFYSNFAGF